MGHVNESDLEWREIDDGGMTVRRKKLGAAAGGERIGCSRYELPPGERSWPYHYHEGNEEALYVLSGRGTLRLDGETRPLREGDYVALPEGEAGAHRVVNDSDAPLSYLAVSTMDEPDVLGYPDSEKIGVFAGSAPGSDATRTIHGYFREGDAVDYWEGERD